MSIRRAIRWLIATILPIVGCGELVGAEFPYVAYVNTADVYIRSGPGRDYYPTDKLQKGEKVEVYRHDPGGWYAIRPPRRSYSWVASRHLDAVNANLAVVNSPRTVARVGSAFSDVRDIIQVRLDQGEKVELIEPKSDSPWCKVAPPAGEFRWVFSKYVDRDETLAGRGGGNDEEPDDGAPAVRRTSDTRSTPRSMASDTTVHAKLQRLDWELSRMVAEDISVWSLADLQQQAEDALKHAEGSTERGQARLLLTKIARFEDIKNRHDSVRQGVALDRRAAPGAAATALQRPTDTRFDGTGRLAPVVSQKSGAPQYALVDGTNSVLSFVTPAPGVNLRPYVDKMVGVNGQRGYLTDLQRQHISVQRVTVLDVERR